MSGACRAGAAGAAEPCTEVAKTRRLQRLSLRAGVRYLLRATPRCGLRYAARDLARERRRRRSIECP
jgi:hypothetical protein